MDSLTPARFRPSFHAGPAVRPAVCVLGIVLVLLSVESGKASSSAATAPIHPQHASSAEAEWNAETERWEISMRIPLVPLEDALSIRTGARLRLGDGEPNEEHQQLIRDYIVERFAFSTNEKQMASLRWFGAEIEGQNLWAYFDTDGSVPDADFDKADSVDRGPETAGQVDTNSPAPTDAPNDETSRDKTAAAAWYVTNSLLLAVRPEQVNVVIVTVGRKTITMHFNAERRTATFSLVPDAKGNSTIDYDAPEIDQPRVPSLPVIEPK